MPSINALQAEFGEDKLVVLLVDISESREKVAQVVARRGYGARVLLDPDGRASRAYRVSGTPTAYLIGRDGMILGRAVGAQSWAQPSGHALLHALLRPASLLPR